MNYKSSEYIEESIFSRVGGFKRFARKEKRMKARREKSEKQSSPPSKKERDPPKPRFKKTKIGLGAVAAAGGVYGAKKLYDKYKGEKKNVSESYIEALTEEKKVIKKVTTPNYKVDDYKNPPKKNIKKDKDGDPKYRTKVVRDKEGDKHLIKLAIMKTKGPRGGTTKATSHWEEK